MTRDEQTVGLAFVGVVLVAVGAFLPWARIGGRNRSGFSTADTFIGLADGALPDAIAWVGRWWYAPTFLALAAFASVFGPGRTSIRVLGILAVAVALAMWWLFVWAGEHWNVLDMRFSGPIVATVGMIAVALACSRDRDSLLHRKS